MTNKGIFGLLIFNFLLFSMFPFFLSVGEKEETFIRNEASMGTLVFSLDLEYETISQSSFRKLYFFENLYFSKNIFLSKTKSNLQKNIIIFCPKSVTPKVKSIFYYEIKSLSFQRIFNTVPVYKPRTYHVILQA